MLIEIKTERELGELGFEREGRNRAHARRDR